MYTHTHTHILTYLCVSCSVSACWPFGRTCAYTPYTRTLWCPCGASCGASEHVWSSYLRGQTLTQSQNNSTTTSSSLLVQVYTVGKEACDDLSRTRRTGTLGCRRAPWDAPSACPFLQMICRIYHSRGSSPLDEWTNIFFYCDVAFAQTHPVRVWKYIYWRTTFSCFAEQRNIFMPLFYKNTHLRIKNVT